MIIAIISAYISTIGFSILFHIPRKELLLCGGIGALGWFVYKSSMHMNLSAVIANFLAALVVSQCSLMLAKVRKMPVTIFLVPGIIPLVPGAATYQAMYAMILNDYTAALEYASSAFQVAGVIAGAIVLTTMLPRIFKKSFS